MSNVFVVYDNRFEHVLGAFSTEEYALEFVEASKLFLGYSDEDFSVEEFNIDSLREKTPVLDKMGLENESIYYLHATGLMINNVMHWGSWSVNRTEYVSGVLNFLDDERGNYAIEYKLTYSNDGRRTGMIRAHSAEEAIKIAEEVMVRL